MVDDKPAADSASNELRPSSSGKDESQVADSGGYGDDVERAQTQIPGEVSDLSAEHREFLLARHGTLDLDPIPSADPADPYNWPAWKKISNLILVAFHACMSTFIAAGIIPAYGEISADLGVSLTRATYLTTLQIAILGGAPLCWKPLSSRYGRRPIFLLSLVCSLAGNIGCAESPSYATMGVCRAITAWFISPAMAIGSGVVTETFFRRERGRYMGVWTLMVTLGVPVGPFIFGFVAEHAGYRWIYWILAIINAAQFVLYLFLGPETRYIRGSGGTVDDPKSAFKKEYQSFRRIDPTPLTWYEFVEPLRFTFRPSAMIPAFSYATVFLVGSILVTVEMPSLFIPKFGFNPQQLGLQFLSLIIGTVIGEQLSGPLSDFWMNRRARRLGHAPQPEYRLWLSYPGFALAIVGVIVFLVQIANAEDMKWNVSPVVGVAIAAAGNQIVTTVQVTYAVDCFHQSAASVGVFVTFVRQIWGFIGPFWFPPMFENVGLTATSGITTALIVAASVIPTALIQWQGRKWRV